jgi:hypothetical protein
MLLKRALIQGRRKSEVLVCQHSQRNSMLAYGHLEEHGTGAYIPNMLRERCVETGDMVKTTNEIQKPLRAMLLRVQLIAQLAFLTVPKDECLVPICH